MNKAEPSKPNSPGRSSYVQHEGWQPHIAAFVCKWCTYAGADMAGTNRLSYPPNVRLIRFPCTGRMNPLFIIKAFEQGVDGVLVSGCHPGDCHYVQGNLIARRRFTIFRSLMELLGLDRRRLHFSWVSASEGLKWVRVVEQVTDEVREAGPAPGHDHPAASLPGPDAPFTNRLFTPLPREADRESIEENMQRLIGTLLREGKVSRAVGFKQGTLPGQVIPTIIKYPEHVSDLIFNQQCFSNLFSYLKQILLQSAPVGIVVKQCDARTVVGLIQEQQISREDVVLVGVPCSGAGSDDTLNGKCVACDGSVSPFSDFAILPTKIDSNIDPSDSKKPTQSDPRDEELAELESLTPNERWQYWQNQFARCLRCYGCRAVCPLCYCKSCISEKHRPQWISTAINARGNSAWNIIRAFHLASRCIGCDECYRVCPAGIRLDLLNRKLVLEVKKQFDYTSGTDVGAAPPLTEFCPDDPDDFIL